MSVYRSLQQYSSRPDFLLAVSMGKVKGASYMRKFASLPLATSGVERDIWEYGSVGFGAIDYTYDEDGTAPIDSLSSSSASDTDPVFVEGLDINGIIVQQVIILTGQVRVALQVPLWRVYRMVNLKVTTLADRSVGFVGQIYCYVNTAISSGVPVDVSKVRSFLNNGSNSTLQSQYTCPRDKTGFFISVDIRNSKKQASTTIIDAHIRNYGSVFRLVDIGALSSTGTSNYTVLNPIPVGLEGGSDVVMTANPDAVGVGIGIVYYILLFDKTIWGLP